MDLGLQNKGIIVTRGSSGIGAAIVDGLAAEGASPINFDRYPPETEGNALFRDISSDQFRR